MKKLIVAAGLAVFEKDEPQHDVTILGRIHVVPHLIGRRPESLLKPRLAPLADCFFADFCLAIRRGFFTTGLREEQSSPSNFPEPSTAALAIFGLVGTVCIRRAIRP
ncbi:hypothetical protein Pr1d_49200 [Bythopirellula goksoeyrii]|uniref:PEP-CTERM protein-sorting domain-containing protein n=1 Tax=Bythopirellula goksoeyrii TaxID=1400387 RepID=A0A5B9QF49_9BACT|nr:hypothetical protein Pr1d_49200 [Bythopirellula goksoeyrii]